MIWVRNRNYVSDPGTKKCDLSTESEPMDILEPRSGEERKRKKLTLGTKKTEPGTKKTEPGTKKQSRERKNRARNEKNRTRNEKQSQERGKLTLGTKIWKWKREYENTNKEY